MKLNKVILLTTIGVLILVSVAFVVYLNLYKKNLSLSELSSQELEKIAEENIESMKGMEVLLLDYENSGGITGACDHLKIWSDEKYFYRDDCRKIERSGLLSSEDFYQLQKLVSNFSNLSEKWDDYKEHGTVDGFVGSLKFYGKNPNGTSSDIIQISAFASKIIRGIQSDSLGSNVPKIFSISGTIDFGNDTGKLSPVFSYNSRVLNDLKRGKYSVELLGRDDSVLFQQDFQPAQIVAQYNFPRQSLYTKILSLLCRISLLNRFNITCPYVDSALGTGGFTLKVPYIDGITTIRLKHGSKILDQLQPGSRFPLIKINPIPTRQLPTVGEFKFSWSANDIDGDKLYYLVLISNDSQKTWKTISSGVPYPQISYDVSRMQKSEDIYFQALASDGINTSFDVIGPFSASIKMPIALIENPKDGDSIQQGWPLILMGSGNSPEEENTIPDKRLIWSSDISGTLGNGQTLQVEKPLPKGKHVITLTVIDKNGNKSSASINLTIK